MTDKKPAKKKRSIPKARILLEVEMLTVEYDLDFGEKISDLISAIKQAIVDEEVNKLT